MRTFLTTKAARRALRPIADLIDQRIERQIRRSIGGGSEGGLQRELTALRHRQRPLELLLDGTGRGVSRMPAQVHLDRAIEELAQVSGDRSGAERNIAQAF